MFGTKILLVLLVSLGVAGCSEKEGDIPNIDPTPLDLATTGVIRGRISYQGAVPRARRVPMGGFAECSSAHPSGAVYDDLMVKNERLQNVFVYIKEGLENRVFAIPSNPVTIDQVGCLYRPRIAGLQIYQPLVLLNSDPLFHNVHAKPKDNKGWNISLSGKGKIAVRRFAKPEIMVPIKCDIHGWMKASVGVLHHPYFQITGPDGSYKFSDVPPGEYLLEAWHEKLGTRSHRVVLGAKAIKKANFKFRAGQFKD